MSEGEKFMTGDERKTEGLWERSENHYPTFVLKKFELYYLYIHICSLCKLP